jgi:hypothetical protein
LRRTHLVVPLLVAAALFATACEGANDNSTAASETGSPPAPITSQEPADEKMDKPKKEPTPSPEPTPETTDYVLGAPVPDRPARLAAALSETHRDIRRAVERWLGNGGRLVDDDVRTIGRIALFQQRIYRTMTRDAKLGRAALRHIDPHLRKRARANFEAGNGLSAGLTPVKPPIRLKTTQPESPHRLLDFYRQAERRFGVDWNVLAAVNFVETRFGRILGPSSAGALGPMQFLPSTWDRYGGGGDILDPHDSIIGAARYLRASGALNDVYSALFAYNHSDAYVQAVLAYARQMKGSAETFYEYYFWQVFVRTTKGDVQLTGPGADA